MTLTTWHIVHTQETLMFLPCECVKHWRERAKGRRHAKMGAADTCAQIAHGLTISKREGIFFFLLET